MQGPIFGRRRPSREKEGMREKEEEETWEVNWRVEMRWLAKLMKRRMA